MYKNIIIAGVPRAGKSTLSRRIARMYGYAHVGADALNAAFERVFPELGINTYADMSSLEILHAISGRLAPFLRVMLDAWECGEQGRGAVLDVYQLLPEDYARHFGGSGIPIVYLITSDVTPEERFLIQKEHDTERDYTFYQSDEELREGCEYIVEQSGVMKRQCIEYDLPYFETARNREEVFERVLREFAG